MSTELLRCTFNFLLALYFIVLNLTPRYYFSGGFPHYNFEPEHFLFEAARVRKEGLDIYSTLTEGIFTNLLP